MPSSASRGSMLAWDPVLSRESAPLDLRPGQAFRVPPHSINNASRVGAAQLTAAMKRQNSSNNKSILHFFKSVPRTSQEKSPGTTKLCFLETRTRVAAASG